MRSKGPLIILMVLIVGLAAIWFLRDEPAASAPVTPQPSIFVMPSPAESPEPTTGIATTQAPAITPAPEITPKPAETPQTTPAPPQTTAASQASPSPSPEPVYSSGGSFTSDTGTGLELLVKWGISTGVDGAAILTLNAYAKSYSLFCVPGYQNLSFSLNGQTYYASSMAVSHDANSLAESYLGGIALAAVAAGTPVSVSWNFNGTYSGVPLEVITAEGSI